LFFQLLSTKEGLKVEKERQKKKKGKKDLANAKN
jgi:hypothetical protein